MPSIADVDDPTEQPYHAAYAKKMDVEVPVILTGANLYKSWQTGKNFSTSTCLSSFSKIGRQRHIPIGAQDGESG